MLTKLRIENFKAWKDTGDIRLAPLTVFFGTNSSGKTSIAQLLLMLKQTTESPDRQRVLHTGDEHTPVDLGTFNDLIHGHDPESQLAFGLSWSLSAPLKIQDPRSKVRFEGDELSFRAEIEQTKNRRMAVRTMEYRLGDLEDAGFLVGMKPDGEDSGEKYDLFTEGYQPVRNQGRKWPLPAPIRFYGFPDETIAYYQNTGVVADLALEMERLLKRLYYVGPLRGYPKRSYIWSGEVPESVGWRGERAVEALLAARNRKISSGFRHRGKTFEEMVARWLLRMELIEEFRVQSIGEHRKDYEVLVRTHRNRSEVNLTDVGFGISQVLPVIVQCFYVQAHAIVLFEQPEIHLHPRVQASLADLFVEAIGAREAGKDRHLQLLVESHSEHFLRRLQRRIAEEELPPEKVAIYFCEPGSAGSRIRELDVDLFGNIRNWPDNFFGDEIGDLAAMVQATKKRRMTAP